MLDAAAATTTPLGLGSRPWRPGLLADTGAMIGLALVALTVLSAIFAPVLGLPGPTATHSSAELADPMSAGHLLGTDQLGRDTLSRLIWGTRPALVEGVLPVVIAALIGSLAGGVAGFLGGHTESITMRGVDILLALPPVMMGIAVAATLGSGVRNVVIAMTIVLVAPMTRVARGAVLSVKNEVFVSAARSLGVSERRIFLRHVLPNAASPIISYAFSLVGIMIVFASGLSFLGLGVQPPTADWGRMVNEGRLLLSTDPWLSTLPGLAIFIVGLGFGLVGEWVDDVVGRR
jgi:peptide/nickel transport system permease protein